jgi:acylpyruvate hydrolase
MRYAASTTEHGQPFVAEVRGGQLIPLDGITEIGTGTSTGELAAAPRLPEQAVPVNDRALLPIVPNPSKIICIGLNYRSHLIETDRDLPAYPVMFPKYASSLIGPYHDIVLPAESTQVDYEGELAVVIGTPGRRIAEAHARRHVLGYTVANDITMRDYQYKTHQWMQGKAWDRSTPLGPYLVTPDEVDIDTAAISTTLNGAQVQASDLSRLIFSIDRLISTISEFTQLVPGDVILTGTPSGVGYRRNPQRFLTPGDTVSVEVAGVGRISSTVRTSTD